MPEGAAGAGRVLVVSLGPGTAGERRVALPAARVRAVAPVPSLTRIPGAPPGLAGLAHARGVALPVLDLARLLAPDVAPAPPGRMVVAVEGGGPVGLLVGRVAGLAEDPGRVETVDLPGLVAAALPRQARRTAGAASPHASAPPAPHRIALVGLTVSGRPYALPLDEVEAVARLPEAPAPGAGPASLGAMPWRGGALPLLSLPALLDLDGSAGTRVAVVRGVGLVAERVGPVLRPGSEAIDPVPRALRHGGAAAGFARLDGGRTLVCILSAQALLGRGASGRGSAPDPVAPLRRPSGAPVMVLDLAGRSYGLPAGAVRAVLPAPQALTRVPRAPGALAGMLAVRGGALPVLDLPRHLGLPPGGERRRLVVVEAEGARVGLLVDGAMRLLREAGTTRPVPDPEAPDAAVTRVVPPAEDGLWLSAEGDFLFSAEGDFLPLIDPAALLRAGLSGAGARA